MTPSENTVTPAVPDERLLDTWEADMAWMANLQKNDALVDDAGDRQQSSAVRQSDAKGYTPLPSAHKKYDQVFVILRSVLSSGREVSPEASVAVVKALWSQEAADDEIARLNQPHPESRATYFWKAARLERRQA